MTFLAAVCLLLLQEVPDLGTRKTGVDWPGFLGPNHDGTSPERGVAPWPAEGPRVVWHRELGEGHATCSVAKGRLFHFERRGDKMRLLCLKSETGEELWTFEYATAYQDGNGAGNGPRCCPVVDEDRVYLFDPDGILHCVGAGDGKAIWKKDTSAEFGVVPNFFGVGSTPIVEGGLLIVQVGGSAPGSPDVSTGETRGLDSGIVAFDKRTGAVKYKATDELASYSSPLTATIHGRRWGFVHTRNALVGFDPATGKVDFRYPWRAAGIQSVNICNPVVAGDLVFVSEGYSVGSSVLRVRPGGYELVWKDGRKRDRAMSAYWATPIHADGHLYGADGMNDADLRCVEMATGTVKWSAPEVRQASLLGVDGHFVALSEDGSLRLIKVDPKRCEGVSKATLKGADGAPLLQFPARAAPILSHGLLYVRGRDRLVCLELIRRKDEHPLPPDQRIKLDQDLEAAVRKATEIIAADPANVDAWSRRGDARFMRGKFADAAADYDKMVELEPKLEAGHWRRGIAWFYAGQHAKAAHQFEIYHTHDDVDRENGIWRYLSQARAHGFDKARQGLLKYAKDDREPFPAVYKLFEGKITPEQILGQIKAAAIDDEDRESRYFYAHLYIGLNAAIENRPEEAVKHLRLAVANAWAPKSGYGPRFMWHVGRLHYELLMGR